ncbi:TnsD family Tn7-like transposition protein [Variovorax guangxiensis]|uniref:TnsD family Tn7-like transposition protein n=1 Tax=Variovorax guangxiensis TaxID=1775474 RepID=UPI002858F7D7|nr:TnsD family Tn7-like transposition protein [Variovorax guangxiensis]MDR6861443.1 hypothetical protein [Variovorax guangxiensis]
MASMGALPYTPSHLEDEALYRYLGRVDAYNCAGSSRRFLRYVFGDSKAISSADLPSNIGAILERWPEISPYPTIAEIIERTSQYPYHRPFIPAGRWRELVVRATHGPGPSLKTWLGLVAQRFSATASFRSCVECDRLAWDDEGVLYWHRAHLLPGVLVCPIHRTPLIQHLVQSEDGARSALRLPPMAGRPIVVAGQSMPSLTAFAVSSFEALKSKDPSLTGDLCTGTYLARLKEMGLCSPTGRPKWQKISSLLLEANDNFRGWAVGDRITDRTAPLLSWLYALFQRPERLAHPLTHIVLIGCLFGSFAAYAAAAKARNASAPDSLAASSSDGDTTSASAISNCNVSCRAAAMEMGLSVSTVVMRRRILGLPIAERRKSLTPDRLSHVQQRLSAGAPAAQVAKEALLSLSSVYRIRACMVFSLPQEEGVPSAEVVRGYRKRWINTGLVSASVRQRRVLDGAAYAWLYHHDRNWLIAGPGHAPASTTRKTRRSRIDWEKRDENYARRIEATSSAQRDRAPRRRRSMSALMRASAPETSLRAQLYRLPRTREALQANAESVPAFQRLRYARAAACLADADGGFTQWKALKLAGLHRPPALETAPEK